MRRSSEALLKAALSLPADELEELASRLLGSMGNAEAEVAPEWRVEIERRLREIDDGTAEVVEGDDFLAWLELQCEVEKPGR